MKMSVSVELEGATETSGKLVELKAELAKLRNMCNAFAPISMKIETDEKDAH